MDKMFNFIFKKIIFRKKVNSAQVAEKVVLML